MINNVDERPRWTVTDVWCCTQFLSATLVLLLPLKSCPLSGHFMVRPLCLYQIWSG